MKFEGETRQVGKEVLSQTYILEKKEVPVLHTIKVDNQEYDWRSRSDPNKLYRERPTGQL